MATEQDTPLVGRVQAQRRGPWADGSFSWLLRWQCIEEGVRRRPTRPTAIRTIPHPGKRDLQDAARRAQTAAEALQDDLLHPERADARVEPVAVQEACRRFLRAAAGTISPHTLRGRERIAWAFGEWVMARGLPTIDRIGQQDVEAWADERGGQIKRSTLNCELSHVQALFTHAWRQRWTARQINLKACRKPNDTPPPEPLLTRELRSALEAVRDPQRHLAAYLLAVTGMRRGELAGLPASAWRAEERILHLEGGVGTTKPHRRDIPVGTETARRIDGYLRPLPPAERFWQPPVSGDQLRHWLAPIKLTPKRLRIWTFTWLVCHGCPEIVAHLLLGHKLRRTTRAYWQGGELETARRHIQAMEDDLLLQE